MSLIISSLFIASDPRAQGQSFVLDTISGYELIALVPEGFDELSRQQQLFLYHLVQAAEAANDIAYDQLHRSSLDARELLEVIVEHGDDIDSETLENIQSYLFGFYINVGPYDDWRGRKFVLNVSPTRYRIAAQRAQEAGGTLENGETILLRAQRLQPFLLDRDFEPALIDKSSSDFLVGSAVNYYEGVTQAEVTAWVSAGNEQNPLNSRVVKRDGEIVEEVYRAGDDVVTPGLYTQELTNVIGHLEQAMEYAETSYQAETIRLLIRFFQTGDLQDFHAYNVHWVGDRSDIDFIMGFIESYQDPRARKGLWESVIYYENPILTRSMEQLAAHAQYFEDRQPWDDRFKKQNITNPPMARVVEVVHVSGDAGRGTPTGIHLPHNQLIRETYGSKNVFLHNVKAVYDQRQNSAIFEEFIRDDLVRAQVARCGQLAGDIQVALHEVVGHASGKVSPTLTQDPREYLPGYYSTIEEARADLVALYHINDPKLIEFGYVRDAEELECVRVAAYNMNLVYSLLRNQEPSSTFENDYDRQRQMTARYVIADTTAIAVENINGETYYRIIDYDRMQERIGELLGEVMRIKGEGDALAAASLVNIWGVSVDRVLGGEASVRMIRVPTGMPYVLVMPALKLVIIDGEENVVLDYSQDFMRRQLELSQRYR